MTIYNYLRKELLFLLSSFILVLISLASCQKQPDLQFGSTYTSDNQSANVVVVDTCTVDMYTSYVDSTSTNGSGYLFVGDYNDSYFGRVSSNAYLMVAPPSTIPALSSINDRYDSVGLLLFYPKSNPYYGDTTGTNTLVVRRVSDLYQLPAFETSFWSNTDLGIDPTVLGSTSVVIQPNRPSTSQLAGDTVKIRLDDALGQQLYNMAYTRSDSLVNTTSFINWFHGLNIAPSAPPGTPAGTAGSAIYGFKDSAILRVYYREFAAPTSIVKFIDFNLTSKSYQFNRVRDTFGTAPIAKLNKGDNNLLRQIPPLTKSDTLGHAGYIQSIGGVNVKLVFPYINSIAQRDDYIGLLRAELTVRPVPNSFNQTWRLPTALTVYSTDQNNVPIALIPSSTSASAQTGNLSLDYFSPTTTNYTFDITTWMKSQIVNTSATANQQGIILEVPTPGNVGAFNRAVLADKSWPTSQRIMLRLYYISLYPHQ